MSRRLFSKPSLSKIRKSLRNNMPKAEWRLWEHLRKKQLHGYKFRRQHSVGKFILDFYCPELKLGIEIDGDSHFNQPAKVYDTKREVFLTKHGIVIMRFTNYEVYNDLEGVLERIGKQLRK